MSDRRRVTIRVDGRVQGVNFRQAARQEAMQLGLSGFARNERDGSVTLEAEGELDRVAEFIDWCSRGPQHARVDTIAVSDGQIVGYQGFIRI